MLSNKKNSASTVCDGRMGRRQFDWKIANVSLLFPGQGNLINQNVFRPIDYTVRKIVRAYERIFSWVYFNQLAACVLVRRYTERTEFLLKINKKRDQHDFTQSVNWS